LGIDATFSALEALPAFGPANRGMPSSI